MSLFSKAKFKEGDTVVSPYGVGVLHKLPRRRSGEFHTLSLMLGTGGQVNVNDEGYASKDAPMPVLLTLEEARAAGMKVKHNVSYYQAVIRKNGKTMLSLQLYKDKKAAEKEEGFLGFSANPTITIEEEIDL